MRGPYLIIVKVISEFVKFDGKMIVFWSDICGKSLRTLKILVPEDDPFVDLVAHTLPCVLTVEYA